MGKHYGAEIIDKVIAMRETGRTHREIGIEFGLSKEQIKKLLERYRRKQKKQEAGIEIRPKGRPRSRVLTKEQELHLYIKRLEREVELYRSFLHAAGRR